MRSKVAVIGGGIIGTSIAYHLARRGSHEVLLFEADRIGSGATQKSVGGIRSLFANRAEIELSQYSRAAYKRLNSSGPGELEFHPCGYLLLATTEERGETLAETAALAVSLGEQVEEIPAKQLAEIVPGVMLEDVRLAAFSPDDGYISDPRQAALTYAGLSAKHGAQLFERRKVQSVAYAKDSFVISAGSQQFQVDQIVVALHVNAGTILKDLNVRLACYPYPRHVFAVTPTPSGLNPKMPVTIFQDEDLMLRFDTSQITTICGQTETSTMDEKFDLLNMPSIKERIGKRIDLSASDVSVAWSGLRAITPDRRALVGPIPTAPGAWCALGFSGHGLMHAPAVGLAVAEMVADGNSTSFELNNLDPARWFEPSGSPPVLEASHQ